MRTKKTLDRLIIWFRHPFFYLIVSFLILCWRVWEYNLPDILFDDAFISFRYAENLANGLGLVFNPGERVEGYTNFLWVMILALMKKLGMRMIPASKLLAGIATFGTLLILYILANHLFRERRFAFVFIAMPLLVFSTQTSQARYVVSGMETALFTFLLTLSIWLLLNRRFSWLMGLGFALAALTRPEGVLYFAFALTGTLVLSLSLNFSDINWRWLLAGFLIFSFLYGTYFLWRYTYFGFLLPNTYYAKASGFQWQRLIRGWTILIEVLDKWRSYLLLGLALLSLPSWKRHLAWGLFPILVIVTLAYFIYVGGDFIVWFGPRFLMPVLPLLLLMSSEGLYNLVSRLRVCPNLWQQLIAFVGMIVVVVGTCMNGWQNPQSLKLYFAPQMHSWAELGHWIKANTPDDFSLATDAAGLIPYYSRRYTYDMFGLTDLHIAHLPSDKLGLGIVAHEKYDPEYILAQKPDCIVSTWMDAGGRAVSANLLSVYDQFVQDYQLVAVAKSRNGPPNDGRWVIQTAVYKPNLFQKGYVSGVFCRR